MKPPTIVFFFFFLLTNIWKVSQSNVDRDETARESGGGRTWSTFFLLHSFIFDTHSYVSDRHAEVQHKTQVWHRLHSIFNSRLGFQCSDARAVYLDVNQTLLWLITILQRPVSIFWTCLRLLSQHHYTKQTHTSKHTCKQIFFRIPSEMVRKHWTFGSQRAGIRYVM